MGNGAAVAAVSMVATPTVELLVAAVALVVCVLSTRNWQFDSRSLLSTTEQSCTISSTLAHTQHANLDAQCGP